VTTLVVPDDGDKYWPTLGWHVAEFMTGWDYLRNEPSDRFEGSVFGPGSLKGSPYQLDGEKLAATLRCYEIFPPEHRFAGRRRFKRTGISWRKGTAKTEWAAQVALVELHPEGPVRFQGWELTRAGDLVRDPITGTPVPLLGRSVRDPFIPMVAYTEEQTEELAYGALCVIVSEGPYAGAFDVGKDRVLRLDHRGAPDGKAVALSGSPNANDGARTTFQHFDETHRMELPRLISAHKTMLANIPKRPIDDPWSLETTTAGRPGGGSVAEATHRFAHQIAQGKLKDARLFYFHRESSSRWDMKKFSDRVEAIKEATGPTGEYAPGQFEEIAGQWDEPDADKSYLERVWCNRWTAADAQAFDVVLFEELSKPLGRPFDYNKIPPGAFCTLGFDGARFKDSTAFVLTEIPTGKQMIVGLWERPVDLPETAKWEVNIGELNETFGYIMRTWKIHKMYGDPPHYVETMADWAGDHPDVVEEWWTNRRRPMAQAAQNYAEAITSKQVKPYDGDGPKDDDSGRFARHIASAGKVETTLLDENGRKLWILGKLRQGVVFDAAMAAVLSWQARIDALASGAVKEETFVPRRLDRAGRHPEVEQSPDAPRPPARNGRTSVRYGKQAQAAILASLNGY
jgi:hypothetical protein